RHRGLRPLRVGLPLVPGRQRVHGRARGDHPRASQPARAARAGAAAPEARHGRRRQGQACGAAELATGPARLMRRETGPHWSAQDVEHMRHALALARRGLGRTRPNPPVGAVVVRGGRVVGTGWHKRAGTAHAEVIALAAAGKEARDATLYLTLEPCTHTGRTPPCAPQVIASGVKRVVIAVPDPNPVVRRRGIAMLRRAGIQVETGLEAEAGEELIRGFACHVTTGRPFVRLKLAASADGRIATRTGASRWITGPDARRLVHRWRDEMDAVMVGSGTLLADDPELTCRRAGGRDPVRVVVDGGLRTPPTA